MWGAITPHAHCIQGGGDENHHWNEKNKEWDAARDLAACDGMAPTRDTHRPRAHAPDAVDECAVGCSLTGHKRWRTLHDHEDHAGRLMRCTWRSWCAQWCSPQAPDNLTTPGWMPLELEWEGWWVRHACMAPQHHQSPNSPSLPSSVPKEAGTCEQSEITRQETQHTVRCYNTGAYPSHSVTQGMILAHTQCHQL